MWVCSAPKKVPGGKYLILPPGHDKPVPAGYFALQSDVFLRICPGCVRIFGVTETQTFRSAIAYGQRVKAYPFVASSESTSQRVHRREGCGVRLHHPLRRQLVRVAPPRRADRALARARPRDDCYLRSLGIEKGKPFSPDSKTKELLASGAREAQALLEQIYDAGFPPFWEGSRWTLPAPSEVIKAQQSNWAGPDYPVDLRGVGYSYAYVGIKRLGAGQMYLITIRDKDGNGFDGSQTYRLTVPPNAPVEQSWSVTLYDRQTHALIKNMDRASRSSQIPEMQKKADGSIDVYFGPKAPAGQESNWIPTDATRGFETMFRLYAPTKPLFEKAWRLPDIERTS